MMTKLLASAALALLGGTAYASVPATVDLGHAAQAMPAGAIQVAATTYTTGDGKTASLSGGDSNGQHADDANDDTNDDHSGTGSEDQGDDHGGDHGGGDNGGSGDGGDSGHDN